MIVKEASSADRILETYGKYFDKTFITVASKTKPKNLPKDFTWFKWCDDFSAARNFNLEQVDTDFWLWLDDDDDIVGADRLKELVSLMDTNSVDVLQLKYDYAQNTQGEGVSDHWRERIMRTSYEGHWDAPVHETFQGPPARWEQSTLVVVKHNKTPDEAVASMERNQKILQTHFEKTGDPRDAYYLGMDGLAHQKYKEAIEWFLKHIDTSGSEEDIYRSWCRIGDCLLLTGEYDKALIAIDSALRIRPAFPDAYYILVLIYGFQEKYENAIEWLNVAMTKKIPETLHMVDPTLYRYRGIAMGAQCCLFSGKVKEAFILYQHVTKENPNFFKELSEKDGIDWDTAFMDAYSDLKALDSAKYLLYYAAGNEGKPEKVFESLPERIFSDIRLAPERSKFIKPKKWPAKSIAIYTGRSSEPWGPDTLDKGMGGSEEAVVYLSRELAKLGWQVTVFNERDEDLVDQGVTYKPWTTINPLDEFDVFVAWRLAGLTRDIKARVKAVDLHDTPIGHAQITNTDIKNTDKFFFKSKFQLDFSSNKPPKDAVVIVGNGIKADQFNED
jgi:tetratricopeptide (TPR) repeat protein